MDTTGVFYLINFLEYLKLKKKPKNSISLISKNTFIIILIKFDFSLNINFFKIFRRIIVIQNKFPYI